MKNIKEYKLSEESAAAELDKLIEYYEIDIEEMPAANKDAINSTVKKLIKFVRLGRLEINIEDGIKCIQTLRDGKTQITYREINGKAKTAMGTKTETNQHGRLFAMLGAISDGETAIVQLKGPDLSLAECLGTLFLSV